MAKKKEEKTDEELEGATDDVESTDSDDTASGETDGKSIVFKIKSPNNRQGFDVHTFSASEHGKDYKAIAKEFAETNKERILK